MLSVSLASALNFSGYEWEVKSGYNKSPGPNNWDDNLAYVDDNGYLHLKIELHNGTWYCSSLHLKESLGYGKYEFSIFTLNLDPNSVVGLFIYESDSKEIDVEISQWRNPDGHNLHYTVQPDNSDELHLELASEESFHSIEWSAEAIKFKSEQNAKVMGEWNYSGEDNFAPDDGKVHLNFWLSKAFPPQENQEILVKSFKFLPEQSSQVEMSIWQIWINKIKKLFKL